MHKVLGNLTIEPREYLKPGWKMNNDRLPTFTTARPRDFPGRKPAGVHSCQPHEIERWQQDSFRFPPYQYVDVNCLCHSSEELRLPDVDEREVILGFPKGGGPPSCSVNTAPSTSSLSWGVGNPLKPPGSISMRGSPFWLSCLPPGTPSLVPSALSI